MYIDAYALHNYNSYVSDDVYVKISSIRSLIELCITLDKQFLANPDYHSTKPIILHFLPSIYVNQNVLNTISLCYRLSLIQQKVPIIAFIEGMQNLGTIALIQSCNIRLMLSPSIIQSSFTYSYPQWAWKAIDV